MEHTVQQEIGQETIEQQINNISFMDLCALLPEDTCWGDSLMPSLLREILITFVSKRNG